MTIEGLAYLAFTYVDLKGGDRFSKEDEEEEPSLPGSTPLESLLALADRREEFLALAKDVKADDARRWPKESFHPELVVAGFQWQVAKIVDAGHPTFYAKPEWLSSGYDALLEDMYELASVLHVVSKGNFLVLHLVTSLWGLEQALMAVEDDTTKLHALRVFWTALQALVVTSGGGYPSRDDIQAVVDDHAAAGKKFDGENGHDDHWRQLKHDAINQVEEHNIKLVYVQYELWTRYKRKSIHRTAASFFCDTPNISPSATSFST
mmetsp:Transcript_15263/g.49875  ORF Transcript_15263/g.49875 Transcript_15263/m.49875 type:complete len:264 (+) Transcript_15263:1499-2290(+)